MLDNAVSRFEKLLKKAQDSPQNIRFDEFQILLKHFGFVLRKSKGSHFVFKRSEAPANTMSIQDKGGMAKPYQVRQFLDFLSKNNLL